jgi:hypothetical protein
VMFLDESGDHNLENIDPNYPVFVLGGVIVDRTYARTVIQSRVQQLKRDFFGRDDIILHTGDIVRAQKDFASLKDAGLKDRFIEALTLMMQELDYTVVACVIQKPAYAAKRGTNAVDVYRYSIEILVERFCDEIGAIEDGGMIFAETRRADLDHDLNLAWEQLKRTGTRFVGSNVIDARIVDLSLKDKRLNIAGLQLADLVVLPIGRAILGKPTQADWTVVESKLRRIDGNYWGPGLVVLPR